VGIALANAERGIAHRDVGALAATRLATLAGLHRGWAAVGAAIDVRTVNALAEGDGGLRQMSAGARTIGATAEAGQHQTTKEQARASHRNLLSVIGIARSRRGESNLRSSDSRAKFRALRWLICWIDPTALWALLNMKIDEPEDRRGNRC